MGKGDGVGGGGRERGGGAVKFVLCVGVMRRKRGVGNVFTSGCEEGRRGAM